MPLLLLLVVLVVAGCAGAPAQVGAPPPAASGAAADHRLTWLNPCGECSPREFCAGWVTDADLHCDRDSDCNQVTIDYPQTDCPWGLYGGGGPSLVISHAAEATVRARMAKQDVCAMDSHLKGGGPCRAPPPACVDHACRYSDAPNVYAF